MKNQAKHGYVVNEGQAQALLNGLLLEEDGESWVWWAQLFLEGVLASAREAREPWALKIEERSDDSENGRLEWTN